VASIILIDTVVKNALDELLTWVECFYSSILLLSQPNVSDNFFFNSVGIMA